MTVDVFDVLLSDQYFLAVAIFVFLDGPDFFIFDFKHINNSILATSD